MEYPYEAELEEVLRQLGIGRNYCGHDRTIITISIALENQSLLSHSIKDIYRATAERSGCHWTAIERNFRTIIRRAWKINPRKLTELAGYPMNKAPTATEFIAILTSYILRVQKRNDAALAAAETKDASVSTETHE